MVTVPRLVLLSSHIYLYVFIYFDSQPSCITLLELNNHIKGQGMEGNLERHLERLLVREIYAEGPSMVGAVLIVQGKRE